MGGTQGVGEVDQMATGPTSLPEMAERLRITRLALKLTQARLCRLARISTQTWNNAETGDGRLGLSRGIRLCEATGLTLEWIYRGIRYGLPAELAEAITRVEDSESKLSGKPKK